MMASLTKLYLTTVPLGEINGFLISSWPSLKSMIVGNCFEKDPPSICKTNSTYGIIFGVFCLIQMVVFPESIYTGPEKITYFRGPHLEEELQRDKRITWVVTFFARNLYYIYVYIVKLNCLLQTT
jgi:hypothetical protein